MIRHIDITNVELRGRIKQGEIILGGNIKLKIYGKLDCPSGKRMKRESRIFFGSANEAIENDFRPCGHCLKVEYKNWRQGNAW